MGRLEEWSRGSVVESLSHRVEETMGQKEWGFQSFKNRLRASVRSCFRANALVREICTQLPCLTGDLEAACKEVEPEFMWIGQELQGIYGNARQLTQQVLDSVNLIDGKDDQGVLFYLRGLAEASLVQLQGSQKDVSDKTTVMQSVLVHLGGLNDVCHALEKVGLLLRVVAVNIGIESARSLESSELFSVVAQDTVNLSDKIRVTVEEGLGVLKEAQTAQQILHADLSHGLEEMNRLGNHAQGIVQEAVQGIESLMLGTRHFVEQVGEHSRQIQRQVGDLVMAIQFHDSMSQRVEHITKALGDAERFLEGDARNNRGIDYGARATRALSIMRLQSAQLREIIAEIQRTYEGSLHSFGEILGGFRALVDHLSEIRSGCGENSGLKGSDGDPFQRLESSFGELNGVIHRGRDLMDGVRHAASRASDTVDRLSKYVRQMHTIGFETHLMALNAIIKAAHLGHEGGAIEVLAREVNQSAVQSRSVLGRAAELLDDMTTSAEHLRVSDSDNTASRTSLGRAMEKIALAYQQFTETAGAAHGAADEIASDIRKTKARLEFLPLLAEKFGESLHQIEATIERLAPLAAGAHDLGHEEADAILNRYTMEREREIHTELSTDGSREDPDKAWDHRELFDTDPGSSEGGTGADEMPASDEAGKDKESFGDNVELF